MPSYGNIVRNGQPNIIGMNNQNALITVSPLCKVAQAQDNGAADLVVLEGEANKSYIIHGYYLFAQNTAGTACTGMSMQFFDLTSGLVIQLDSIKLTANAVNMAKQSCFGLNVPTMPGKDIILHLDAAADWRIGVVYYSEVVVV